MKITSLLVFAAIFVFATAHLSSKGIFKPFERSSLKAFRLPPLDNNVLVAEEDDSHGGYQFGFPMDYSIDSSAEGEWSETENAKVWTLTLKSSTAKSIGVTFKNFNLPVGGELYIVGEEKTLGAYTHINNPSNGIFTTFPLSGNTLTIQYFQPLHLKTRIGRFNIMKITHGYKAILGFGSSGSCNNNAACDDGTWADQIRSSGMLMSGFGSRFCSGAMINNVAGDKSQYFLTAYHCSVDSADLIMFNYQSAKCSPNTDGNTDDVIGGLVKLAEYRYSDFAFFEVEEKIPASWNVYLSGFSAENTAPRSMVGIHHPAGDVKKISYANKAGIADTYTSLEPGNYHWRVSSWDDGTTEGGSSGSPLYDQNQRIVGQLHGGAASCSNISYDKYGAVWASWLNGLNKYLDPQSTGIKFVNGTNLS